MKKASLLNRRKFLRLAGYSAALPVIINGFGVKSFSQNRLLNNLLSASGATDKVLVLIQMSGGNDGLNMIIPLDQYSV